MLGRVFWYSLELNTELDEVRLAFPELEDIFPNVSHVDVTSKTFDDIEEAMQELNEDAYKRLTRLATVNQEHEYKQLKIRNPFKQGVPDSEITEEDREFWSPDKLSILIGIREGEDQFMLRYTFYLSHESEQAAELNEDIKALPWDSQFSLLNNLPSTLQ